MLEYLSQEPDVWRVVGVMVYAAYGFSQIAVGPNTLPCLRGGNTKQHTLILVSFDDFQSYLPFRVSCWNPLLQPPLCFSWLARVRIWRGCLLLQQVHLNLLCDLQPWCCDRGWSLGRSLGHQRHLPCWGVWGPRLLSVGNGDHFLSSIYLLKSQVF